MQWTDGLKRALAASPAFRKVIATARRAAAPRRPLGFESLEPRWVLSHVAPGLVDAPQTYSGPLTGKVVFTSPGHGWQWSASLNRYATDRPEYQLVEDFGTQDQMTLYADYLLRAGATVVPMRPVGRQINQVVLDNDSAGVTFTGAWSNSTGADYYDEDYGSSVDSVSYRFASTTTGAETSVATYTPNIPAAGFYPVYTWVARSGNRTTQLYRINHTGGATEIRVDHRQVGYGWVYLGTYHFGSGSSSTLGSVQISNNSAAGGVVIADAIRFGNGMGDFTDSGAPGPSGYPREDENSYKWVQRMLGVGTTSTEAIGAGTNNVSAPSNMAEWMYDANGTGFGGAVYVGIHSNGTTGNPDTATARGAVGLIDTDAADRTPHQADLALFLGRQINQDMQALPGVFEYNWSDRTTHTFTSQFGEIDLGTNAEMDATIIEVAFHDNIQDGALLRDPKARDQIARAMYQGTLEYFDVWGGLSSPVSLPTAPINVRAVSSASGAVTINWSAGANTPASVNGAAASGFRVYASVDGYGFDGGTLVNGGGSTSVTLTGFDPTRPYYFRVTAVNAGGESKPSEVMTALPSGGAKNVLIVNGFDRFDRTQDFEYPYAYTGDGLVDRVWSRYNNSFDYVIQVHSAIHAAHPGTHVASTNNESVASGAVNLNDYDTVIWILGEESTANDTFNATEQTLVEAFIAAGGNLFTSGSEIAWDLDAQGGGVSFFENTLKGNYVANDGNSYNVTVPAGSIFAGIPNFSFSNGSAYSQLDSQFYNVEAPDVINPQAGAVAALRYNGGTNGNAAIQVQGTGGRGSVVVFGFPFETITSAARRTDIMREVLDFFTPAIVAIDVKTRVNGLDADSPTGPILAAGGSATFTYVLTNLGNVPLSAVAVNDDNGTPGVPGDDFAPTLTSGDSNSNNQLDVGETWTFTASRTVAAGQFTNTGSVSAIGNAQPATDSDVANYFGAAPGINVIAAVESQDANSPPGPVVTPGSPVNFTYIVTNTGNMTLSNVVVSDDNGTPGNAADDFNPIYLAGDTNSDNQLQQGETWVFFAARTAIAGQYTGIGTASGQDSIAQIATDSDATNYLGIPPDDADFNDDNFVDTADYVIWRKNENTSVPPGTLGDANHDGQVNDADYQIWRAQYGTSPPASSSLSEPGLSSDILAPFDGPASQIVAAGMVPVGSQPVGPLTGKIVYTSAGHGWQWSSTLGRWATDRGDNNEIVEDFGNQDQMTYYADYLLRAGATVVPMRPVGRQTSEVVVDNDLAAVTYTGSWTNSTTGARWYDEDYGAVADSVRYRSASTSVTETATATYTPNIPAAGFYPVYTWVSPGTNRTNQLYKINHTGGQFQIRVDHTKVGNGWVYLGTYHFNAGSSATEGSVVISNQGAAGAVVIADAIRFGNGMGDVPWGASGIGTGSISTYPREDEASILWLWRGIGLGVTPSSVLGTSNVSAPSNMALHMNQAANPFGGAVYIGFHSNAGGGRGAVGLIDTDVAERTPHQGDLALFTGRQINQDMQALNGTFENDWSTRTTHTFTGEFGEINLGTSAEMDATIIEVAFHDTLEDAELMRDPKARDQLARSTYQATLEYFDVWGGLNSPVSLPTAPTSVRAVSNVSGAVTINWAAGPSTPASVYGGAATGFRIFASVDGYGFDGGTFIAGGGATSATLTGYDPTKPYYFKVVAENAGGQSLASEVVTALPSGGPKQVLIVNGFDRFDRTLNFRYGYAFTGDGLVDRVWSRYNNSFDYAVQVHTAIHAAHPGVHVAGTSNEAVISGAVNLNDYHTVIWILGEESTANETFNSTEQTKVEQFIAGGGNLFLSGAEIGWDLDRPSGPTAADRSFYENTLKANYVADDAGTYTTTPVAAGIFNGMNDIVFSNGASFSSRDGQFYNTDFPDVIAAQAGGIVALNYVGGTGGGAAIQVPGTGGRGSIVMFGFPFETITNATRRQNVIDRVFDFFGLSAIVPDNADFNNDNIVDIADYVIWRNNENTSVPPGTLGDANHDGQVNSADYQIWRAQFGTSPASAASAARAAEIVDGAVEQSTQDVAIQALTSTASLDDVALPESTSIDSTAVKGAAIATESLPASTNQRRAVTPAPSFATVVPPRRDNANLLSVLQTPASDRSSTEGHVSEKPSSAADLAPGKTSLLGKLRAPWRHI